MGLRPTGRGMGKNTRVLRTLIQTESQNTKGNKTLAKKPGP
jgi:hypothetical protein